jgi:hypothetical protein
MSSKTAKAQAEPAPVPVAEPEQAPIVHCHECKHWDRRWPQANVADCMLSARFGTSPVKTTDMTSCSQGARR